VFFVLITVFCSTFRRLFFFCFLPDEISKFMEFFSLRWHDHTVSSSSFFLVLQMFFEHSDGLCSYSLIRKFWVDFFSPRWISSFLFHRRLGNRPPVFDHYGELSVHILLHQTLRFFKRWISSVGMHEPFVAINSYSLRMLIINIVFCWTMA